MPAEVFMNELINSLRRDRMGEFREKFRRVHTLILDDIQFLAASAPRRSSSIPSTHSIASAIRSC